MTPGRAYPSTALPPSTLLDLSDRFVLPPGPDGQPACELRAFTHGLMPVTVPAMMQAFTDDWAERGVDAWNRVPDRWDLGHEPCWWTLPDELGDRWIAPLLSAAPGTCVMQPNVHWTVAALLSCDAPFAGRSGVVLSEAEFPSVRHNVRQWAGLRDLAIHEVPAPGGRLDMEALLSAITDDTAWVFVSHVGFATGEKQPDDALRALAEEAVVRGTGARALRSIFEHIMLEIMYEIPSRDDVESVTINRSVVDGSKPPIIKKKRADAA